MSDTNLKGYYSRILVFDAETTGLCSSNVCSPDTADNGYYQAISYGMIVANADTYEAIEKLYLEVKWDGISLWSSGAEKVHGLSKEHLEQYGLDEEDAVAEIATLIYNHWGDKVVSVCAQNPHFDIAFLDSTLKRHGIHVKFSNRRVDTSTLGAVLLGAHTSDQIFSAVGIDTRGIHNSLQDAECCLQTLRTVRMLWKACVE